MSLKILHQIRYAQEDPDTSGEITPDMQQKAWEQAKKDELAEQRRKREEQEYQKAQRAGVQEPWEQYLASHPGTRSRQARWVPKPDGTLKHLLVPGFRFGPIAADPALVRKNMGQRSGPIAMTINQMAETGDITDPDLMKKRIQRVVSKNPDDIINLVDKGDIIELQSKLTPEVIKFLTSGNFSPMELLQYLEQNDINASDLGVPAYGTMFQQALEDSVQDEEGYVVGFPTFLSYEQKIGGKGWISNIFSPSKQEAEENDTVNVTVLHPSLLDPHKHRFSNKDLAGYESQYLADKSQGQASWNYFLALFINDYILIGHKLKNNPELSDNEELLNFWEKWMNDTNMIDRNSLSLIGKGGGLGKGKSFYDFMWRKAEEELRSPELGRLSPEDFNIEIARVLDQTLGKLLSGYVFKSEGGQISNIQGYVSGTIKSAMKGVATNYWDKENKIEKIGGTEDDERTGEDRWADTTADTAEQAIQNIEKAYLGMKTEREKEDDDLARGKKDPAPELTKYRGYVLDGLQTLANLSNQPYMLQQWTKEFKQFLIHNKSMQAPRLAEVLGNILPYIKIEGQIQDDLGEDILNEEDIDEKDLIVRDKTKTSSLLPGPPCPECGAVFAPGLNQLALVPLKGHKFRCLSCGNDTDRANDMLYALNAPLLAFLNMKKREYLSHPESNIAVNISGEDYKISDWIEWLMNFAALKIVGQGPSRWGKSYAGREPIWLYRDGKFILARARQQNLQAANQGIQDTIRDFISLHQMPPEELWAGTEFPTGGYTVGSDKQAPLGYGGPVSTEWGKEYGGPKSKKGRSLNPTHPYAPNEIVNAMVVNELLPMVLRDPGMQQMVQGMPSALFEEEIPTHKNYMQKFEPYVRRTIALVNESQKALTLKYGQPVPLTALFEPENQELLAENIFALRKLFVRVPDGSLIKFLYTVAASMEHVSQLSPEDLENLTTQQILPLETSVEEGPLPGMAGDPTAGLKPPMSMMSEIAPIEDKISAVYAYLIANNIIPPTVAPEARVDPNAMTNLAQRLTADGVLSDDQSEDNLKAMEIAVERILFMRKKTQELVRALGNGTLSYDPNGIFQLSEVISNTLVDNVIKTLTTTAGNAESVLDMNPAMRYLFYSTAGGALVSDYQLFRDLLLSVSGLFGLSGDYTLPESYKAIDAEGTPISELSSTLDAAKGKATFTDSWRKHNPADSPSNHPRFIDIKVAKGNVKLFVDQFSPEALANKYGNLFANVPQFQNIPPQDIIKKLQEEVLNLVQRYYIGPESELAQRSPDAAARAAATFFIPTDLLDDAMDVVSQSIIERRNTDFLLSIDPYEIAGEILFMIKDMVDKRKYPNNIVAAVQAKYPGMRVPLLMKIIEDISQGKGSATRAIQALGNVNNIRRLGNRTAANFKAFIKYAMKRIDRELEV